MRVVKSQLSYCLHALAELAEAGPGVGVTALAERLGAPKSSCQRLLQQLLDEGWVEQDETTSSYRLTLRLPVLGQLFLTSLGMTDAVQAILDDLARRTRELTRLTLVEGERLVWFASAQGADPGLMYQPAMETRIVSFATANGKAWLARLAPDAAQAIALREGVSDKAPQGVAGPNAHRSLAALQKDLAAIRKRGYAVAVEEAERGITAIARAVCDPVSGAVLGTISVAGPTFRLPSDRYVLLDSELEKAASQISRILPRKTRAPANKGAAR